MNTTKLFLTLMFAALLGNPMQGWADDIDIYSGSTSTSNMPNVMIIIDNASNSNASMGACTYWDGAVPTADNQGTKSLDNYMCALDSIVHGLTTRSDGSALVKLGITTQAGVYLKLAPVDDNAYTGTFPGTSGKTNRQAISIAIRALTTVNGSANQGASFQETWAYYTGGNGGTTNVGEDSGTAYSSAGTNATTGCQKNFNIFISGVTSSAHSATASSLTNLTNAVNNAVGSGTALATALLTPVTGVSPEKPYGIEWARFMSNTDANSTATGTQNIITYSVAAGSPVYPAAMGSWEQYIYDTAHYGGGKYFAATSYTAIYQDILKILNEVQAVNSVFASSSLPVSVNAQGTYLNQIYMGMFRPDPNANPRWLGNLKQYQFIMGSTGALQLGDSLGNAALSSAGTGFISPNAVSFWTCGHTGTACGVGTEPTNGFWANDPSSLTATPLGFDLPDGALVERGGAAQQIRMANLNDDYTTTAGTSTNPRKLYTYCPGGSSCNTDLTNSSNAFATGNVGISVAQFGASSLISVQSIVRTGTSALVTTAIPHGFPVGTPLSVTITGATQPEYNVTQSVTPATTTTFTITGLPDNPPTPNTGTYTVSVHGANVAQNIGSVSVATSTTANANGCTSGTIPNINCDQVTVTLSGHGYSNGNSIVIAGVSPSQYSGTFVIGNVTANTFTYNVPVTPTSPSVNAYSAQLPAVANLTNVGITVPKNGTTYTATVNNTFSVNDSVTITSCSAATKGTFIGTYTITAATSTTFTYTSASSNGAADSVTGCTVAKNIPVYSIAAGAITRASATATTATAALTSGSFATGSTVNLAWVSGANGNETAYAPLSGNNSVAITCVGASPCSNFTFPITTLPTTSVTAGAFISGVSYTIQTVGTTNFTLIGASSNTVGVTFTATGAGSGTGTALTTGPTVTAPTATLSGIPVTIGAISRAGTTATASGVGANAFVTGSIVDLTSSNAPSTEAAYLSPAAGWIITCTNNTPNCNTFTFGPVTLTPATPATGTIKVYSGSTPLDKNTLVNWVRGDDNQGDELGPGSPVTVRPSVHGDVLHSRPTVVNYGGSTGVVVYYGDNGGIFHAVNGNQANPTGSTMPVPGSELWGFIPSEFFARLGRQMTNSPPLLMPSTPPGITPAPAKKDYFVDGGAGLYQVIDGSGNTTKAYLYLSMRRGGNLIYALDVTNPATPTFLWKVDNTSAGMGELGQTWSQPKVAKVEGYVNPVLIFGAGYDANEDNQPPTADSSGRGIFVLDAITGALVWKATYGATSVCPVTGATTTQASCTVSDMNYAIPADITLTDRDGDGIIERLYAADTGGNIWRVDLEPVAGNTPDKWRVYKLAALGCDTGPCSAGTTPRKFLYPPDVIPATATYTYDSVVAGSGDREHPLHQTTGTPTSDKLFLIKDTYTGNDATGMTPITLAGLFDATSFDPTTMTCRTPYYITLASEEKVVNAPLVAAGYAYMGTNQPATASSNSCTANLGIAKGYRLNPFACTVTSIVYSGGGLPPSPVGGVVNIVVGGVTKQVPFIMGGGGNPGCVGSDCSSGLGGQKPPISVPANRTRTYWYQNK